MKIRKKQKNNSRLFKKLVTNRKNWKYMEKLQENLQAKTFIWILGRKCVTN